MNKIYILIALVITSAFSFAVSAQDVELDGYLKVTGSTPGIFDNSAITGKPDNTGHVGVTGQSRTNHGIVGLSFNRSGVFGQSYTGIGIDGSATSAEGTGVSAVNVFGGLAMYVEGAMEVNYTPGNLIKVYDPDTGKLLGVFEFEIVNE